MEFYNSKLDEGCDNRLYQLKLIDKKLLLAKGFIAKPDCVCDMDKPQVIF